MFKGEWRTIKPYPSILRLVARISARVFLGLPLCRDEKWLEISTEFTENGKSHDSRVTKGMLADHLI